MDSTTKLTKAAIRSARYELRLSADERDIINVRARLADKAVSVFIRDLALGSPIIQADARKRVAAARELNPAVLELRKIGAMLRGLYPKNDTCWSNEEKRRYWSAMTILLQKADAIEKRSLGV
jgi:uncharacterized protein (DUF1778 family)